MSPLPSSLPSGAARRPLSGGVSWPALRLGGFAWLALVVVATSAVLLAQDRPGRDRSMFVAVLDGQGAPVPGLTPTDFIVREDGVQREVLRAEPATTPIEMTVMVDTSQPSMPAIADLRTALTAYFKQVGNGNTVALTAFGGPPKVLQTYTTSVAQLEKGVGRVFAEQGSGAYLLQALMSVTQGLKKRAPERAEVLAILMRSAPEYSNMLHDRVLEELRTAGARFDAITISDGEPPSAGDQRSAIRERDTLLDEGARATGGRNEQVLASLALAPRLQSIGNELLHQYRIVYARPESLIPPEKIEVRVKKPGLVARGTPVKGQQ